MDATRMFVSFARPAVLLAVVLAPAAANAQVTTMTFEPPCTVGAGPHALDTKISEGGFTLNDVPAPGGPAAKFLEWCTPSPNFLGAGVWTGGLGTSAELTRDGGGLFQMDQIDLARLTPADQGDVSLTFVGHKLGGADVFQTFLVDLGDGEGSQFQTFDFNSDFTDLTSLDFAPEQAAPSRYQFTNVRAEPVTATPEPASMSLVATGLVGLIGVARRRRKAQRAA